VEAVARLSDGERARTISEFSTMRKTAIWLLVLVVALAMAGCSALEISARSTRKAVSVYGLKDINTVRLWRDNVISFGRFYGADEVEIKQTIEVAVVELGDRGRVRFLVPSYPSSTDLDELHEYLETDAGKFADALTRTLADYLTMVDVVLEVDVVLASEPGSYYSSQASIRDRMLLSLLFYDPFADDAAVDEQGAGRWWAELSDVAAHELYHLHSYLMGSDRERVDEEAAANLFGACAAYRYGLRAGVFTETIEHFDLAHGPEIKRYFPEIDEGRLNPDMHEVNKRPHPSLRGQVLSVGVFYLLAGSNEIHPVDDKNVFKRIFDYCDGLVDRVPEFHRGEWRLD